MLTAHGFQVHDLGVDVAGNKFAAKAGELKADMVGVSALLTTTMRNQKSVVEALEKEALRPQVKVMVEAHPSPVAGPTKSAPTATPKTP
jgi:dimethylamine corrinoid protein